MCSLKKSLSEDEIVLLEKNRNTFYKPLITADEIAHSSVSKKKGRTKINRPLNSFIVFKKNLNKVIKEKNYVWGKNMKNATRYASYLWRIANTEEKKIFDDIAKKSRKIHKELHPGYNYTPINKRTSNFVIVKFNNDDGKSNNHNNNNSNNNNININDNSNCHISDNSNFNINNNNNESNITSSTVTSTTSTTAFTTISSTKDNVNEGDDNNSSFTTIPSPSSITIIQPIITSPLLFSTASIPLHSITHPVSTTLLTYAFDMNNLPTDCYNNYNDNNYYTYSENYDNNGMLYTCTLDPNAYMTGDSDPLENPDDNSNLSILSILPNK